jgi:hypothetical protein
MYRPLDVINCVRLNLNKCVTILYGGIIHQTAVLRGVYIVLEVTLCNRDDAIRVTQVRT